jgi:hypothetical protein
MTDSFVSAANRELETFLQRADRSATGIDAVSEADLRMIGARLQALAPELADASRYNAAPENTQNEIQKYIGSLRILRGTLEELRRVMKVRQVRLESARQHLDGLNGFARAYRITF